MTASRRFLASLAAFSLAAAARLGAQAPSPPAPSPAPSSAPPPSLAAPSPSPSPAAAEDLVASTMALDIATAGIYELDAWCESLGLPRTGTVDELRTRLYGHYGAKPPSSAAGKGRTITVKNAGKAESFLMEGIDERYVRFSGGVVLVLVEPEKNWTHEIHAREILVNQTASLLSARGDVTYTLKKPGSEERFSGEWLDVDLDTWTGHFLDGRIVRTGGAEDLQTKFVFAADVVRTGDAERAVFDNAVISSAETGMPYYSIRATRVWLLGPGEWAMSNAVLSVGEVPLLYLPFFFYNGEELVFHPVVGDRDREGPFFQTTYYFKGQKPAGKESISLLQLQASKDSGPRKVKGLYIVPAKEGDEDAIKKTQDVFKLMLDGYSNLGAFLGTELRLTENPKVKVNLFAVAAITRNVYSSVTSGASMDYTPYVEAHDWKSVWNASRFLGLRLPFRYGADFSLTLALPPLSATLAFPFFSDPYVEGEFKNRKEDMDWFAFLKESKTDTAATVKRSSLDMRAELSLAPSTAKLSPYVTTASLSYLRTKLSWLAKTASNNGLEPPGTNEDVDPTREFFYPDLLTMVDASAKIAGTLASWPPKASAVSVATAPTPPPAAVSPDGAAIPAAAPPLAEVPPIEDPDPLPADKAYKPPDPLQPWEEAPPAETAEKPADEKDYPLSAFRVDALKAPQAPQLPAPQAPFTFTLGYAMDPSATLERRFLAESWPNPEDVDWAALHDKSLVKFSGSLDAAAAFLGGAASASLKLGVKSQVQDHFNLTEDETYLNDDAQLALVKTDAQARSDNLTGTARLSAKPFTGDAFWGESSLSWDLSALLYDYRYETMDGETPVFATRSLEWNTESIPTHSLTATVVALPLGWRQSLSLVATLPPKDESYSGALSSRIDDITLTASSKIYRPANQSDWKYDPLSLGALYSPGGGFTLSDTFVQNLEAARPESNATTVGFRGLSATFNMRHSPDYYFDSATTPMQWRQTPGSEGFRPTDMNISFSKSDWKDAYFWKNRIKAKPTVSTSLAIDFQQFTKSNFNLNLGAQASVNEFLDISLSYTSQNASIFWYFVGLPGFEMSPEIDENRRNLFKDILDSITFFVWDEESGRLVFSEEARRRSLFKLKNIGISLVHHMHDWTLTVDLSAKPVLRTVAGVSDYVFTPSFSLAVQWKPISELKTKTTVTENAEGTQITIE